MFFVRDLVSPCTWLAMTSHLAGLFTGLAVMVVVVTGLSLGFSLVVWVPKTYATRRYS